MVIADVVSRTYVEIRKKSRLFTFLHSTSYGTRLLQAIHDVESDYYYSRVTILASGGAVISNIGCDRFQPEVPALGTCCLFVVEQTSNSLQRGRLSRYAMVPT
jgi:hypothetical protein